MRKISRGALSPHNWSSRLNHVVNPPNASSSAGSFRNSSPPAKKVPDSAHLVQFVLGLPHANLAFRSFRNLCLPRKAVAELEKVESVPPVGRRRSPGASPSDGGKAPEAGGVPPGAPGAADGDDVVVPVRFQPATMIGPLCEGPLLALQSLSLGQRVSYAKVGGALPLGTQGVVIGVYFPVGGVSAEDLSGDNVVEVLLDAPHFGGGTLGGRCGEFRGLETWQRDLLVVEGGAPPPQKGFASYQRGGAPPSRAAAVVPGVVVEHPRRTVKDLPTSTTDGGGGPEIVPTGGGRLDTSSGVPDVGSPSEQSGLGVPAGSSPRAAGVGTTTTPARTTSRDRPLSSGTGTGVHFLVEGGRDDLVEGGPRDVEGADGTTSSRDERNVSSPSRDDGKQNADSYHWKQNSDRKQNSPSRDDGKQNTDRWDNWNRGDWNRGDWNRGDWDRGDWNRGDWNRGDWSRDDGNRGDGNRGDGNRDDGNRDSSSSRDDRNRDDGDRGDWNRGDWNRGDWSRDDGNRGDRSAAWWPSRGGDEENSVMWVSDKSEMVGRGRAGFRNAPKKPSEESFTNLADERLRYAFDQRVVSGEKKAAWGAPVVSEEVTRRPGAPVVLQLSEDMSVHWFFGDKNQCHWFFGLFRWEQEVLLAARKFSNC